MERRGATSVQGSMSGEMQEGISDGEQLGTILNNEDSVHGVLSELNT